MSRFFFACDAQLFQHHLLKRLSFPPLNCLCSFVKDQLSIFVPVYFWALYSVPLIDLSVLLPVSHCLADCSFVISLEVRQCQSPNFVLLLQYCVGFSRSLASSTETSESVCGYPQSTRLRFWLRLCWIYKAVRKASSLTWSTVLRMSHPSCVLPSVVSPYTLPTLVSCSSGSWERGDPQKPRRPSKHQNLHQWCRGRFRTARPRQGIPDSPVPAQTSHFIKDLPSKKIWRVKFSLTCQRRATLGGRASQQKGVTLTHLML